MSLRMPASVRPNLFRLLTVMLVMVSLGATTNIPADASNAPMQLRFDGMQRSYAIHVPAQPAPPGGFPLVLAFHGDGMRGDTMRRMTQLDRIADQRGFIVVYPDGVDRHWNDGRSTIRNPHDDVAFVTALIERLGQDHAIDMGRVYATGISSGALFAERLGCDLSQEIAAIAPVAGTMPAELAPDCRPAHPVASLHINGTEDPVMPFDGGAVADFGGRAEGGMVLSAARTVGFWAQANGCRAAGTPQLLPLITPPDPTQTVRTAYVDCPAHGPVMQLTVMGGGHAWPSGPQASRPALIGQSSRQFDASVAITDFFLSLPRRAGGARNA